MNLRLEGREICFWCVESHRGCHLHENSNVFWNDVSIRPFFDDDGYRIVNEKQLINVENPVKYSFGKFSMSPPTTGITRISAKSPIFHFEKCEKPTENVRKVHFREPEVVPKLEKMKVEKVAKSSKIPKKFGEKIEKSTRNSERNLKKLEVKEEENRYSYKNKYYSKIHKNAMKTSTTVVYTKGKKCDQSQKMFVCDICEFSFTLRHNLQVHLCTYHGETANMTEEILTKLKRPRGKGKQVAE